jgi:hypothetical protein
VGKLLTASRGSQGVHRKGRGQVLAYEVKRAVEKAAVIVWIMP